MVIEPSPKVSLILPTHNRIDLLFEAVRSVSAQTFSDWELIVVDNASEPAVEAELLKEFQDSRIRVLRNTQNLGGAAAKSLGAQEAKGKYLAFLDDDDLLHPGYLEEAYGVMENHSRIKTLFMGVEWFGEKARDGQLAQDENMRQIRVAAVPECDEKGLCFFDAIALFAALMERIPMPFQRLVVSRKHYFEVGQYRPECLLWDCDWALRALVKGPCALLDKGLYRQRAQRQGYSSRAERRMEQEESKIEMKQYLFSDLTLVSEYREILLNSLSKDLVSYAWQLQAERRWDEANRALRRAANFGLKPQIIKLFFVGLTKRVFGKSI